MSEPAYEIVVPLDFLLITEDLPPFKEDVVLLTKVGEFHIGYAVMSGPEMALCFVNKDCEDGDYIEDVIAWQSLPTIYLRKADK